MEPRVLRTVDERVVGPDGSGFRAKICGRETADGRWEAWIEFIPDEGPVLRSRRETTQSDLANLERWASRLSRVYLEGSLERTLELHAPRRYARSATPEVPRFDGPAPPAAGAGWLAPDDVALNPFLHIQHGEDHLRHRLDLLSASELWKVVVAFGMDEGDASGEPALSAEALVELIVARTKSRT